MPKIILRQTEPEVSIIVNFDADNQLVEYDITIGVDQEATYINQTLTNVDTVVYEVNTVPKTLPFTLVDGDVLNIILTRLVAEVDSIVKLSNS